MAAQAPQGRIRPRRVHGLDVHTRDALRPHGTRALRNGLLIEAPPLPRNETLKVMPTEHAPLYSTRYLEILSKTVLHARG
ncbi:hypothetical protein [Xanthomonas phaseoli]|uniref:hypothetical protein n=1 Tax=Xanthomonas phaseoli TaxID=1985254 RepID=UPI001EE67161|nr:hypothetical protein [Xanthomonas phaseoli]